MFKNTNYFYAVRISISSAILSEIFIQIGNFFQELYKKTKVDVFFLNTVYNDWATAWWRNRDDTLSRFDTIPECDGQTHRHTEFLYQYSASALVRWRTIKIICRKYCSKWNKSVVPVDTSDKHCHRCLPSFRRLTRRASDGSCFATDRREQNLQLCAAWYHLCSHHR